MLSPRNQIEVPGLHWKEIESVDILFDLCDVEFKSRVDVHNSFREAKGTKSWARYYLLHEVRKVAARESIYCSYHMAFVTATKLSQMWFKQKETL
jgi:hypothetical protein